jgi:hypothetical protein
MSPRALTIAALPLILALPLGCGSPPPPPPPPQIAEAPPPPPPPPPPPKCEALEEKCEAKPDTHAKIAHTELVFTPPSGWIYAQLAEATVAQSGDATLAAVGFDADAKDAKKDTANRDAAFSELLKQIGVENPGNKKKVPWKKPDTPKPVGDYKLALWELKDWVRASKKGPLVAVAGPTSEGKGILFIGFVPADDKSGADEGILKAIESLGTSK